MQRYCPPGPASSSTRNSTATQPSRRQTAPVRPQRLLACTVQAHAGPEPSSTPTGAGVSLVNSKCGRKALRSVFKSYRKQLEQHDALCGRTAASLASIDVLDCPVDAPKKLVSGLLRELARLEQTSNLERYLPEDPTPDNCIAPTLQSTTRRSAVGLAGGLEVVPPPVDWDEEAYASMSFPGSGKLLVCQGSKCRALGAGQVLAAVSALSANSPGVEVVPCKCVGKCKQGPAMRVRPQNQACAVYTQLTPQQLPEVFAAHFSEAAAAAPAPEQHACCVECKTHTNISAEHTAAESPALVTVALANVLQ